MNTLYNLFVMIEELRAARENSGNVAYMKFISLTSEGIDGYFCFFEGKDSHYYLPRIRSVYTDKIHPINCGGKSKVLHVYRLIHGHKEYWKYKKGFFVDLDFDESIKGTYNPPIYETPSYSIENLYSTTNVFSEILKSEFGFVESDEEYKMCIDMFNKRKAEYHKSVITFNAWYLTLKQIKKENSLDSTGINLDEKLPKGYLKASLEKVDCNYDLNRIKDDFPYSIKWTKKRVKESIKILSSTNLCYSLRGKYEIEFMSSILRLIIDDANDKSKRKLLKVKTKFNFDTSRFNSQLSQYAETPDCLIEYIELTTKKIFKYKKAA